MAEFYKSFLQSPIFTQLVAAQASNGNNLNGPSSVVGGPSPLNAQQQPHPASLASSGHLWLDIINNQENKANNAGLNAADSNGQRLRQSRESLIDAAKMMAAPVAASGIFPKSEPTSNGTQNGIASASSQPSTSSAVAAPSSVISQGLANAAVAAAAAAANNHASSLSVKEESRSSATIGQAAPNNANNNNASGLVLSQPMMNSWLTSPGQHQQAADQLQKGVAASMAEQLRMMTAFGFPGFGVNPALFAAPPMANGSPFLPQPQTAAAANNVFQQQQQQQQQQQHHQQQQQQQHQQQQQQQQSNQSQQASSQSLPPMFPPPRLPGVHPSMLAPAGLLGGGAPFPQPNNPMLAGLAPPDQPTQPTDTDQFYAQLIQDTLRHNMAAAAASLFSGAPASMNAANASPLWAALIAQQIQQQMHQVPQQQPQQLRPQQPPQPQILFQNALNDQQRNCESAKPVSSISEGDWSKAHAQNLPTKVSTGTSPGVANNAATNGNGNDMAAMGSHERVHYWLYGQSLTSPLPPSLTGRESSPVVAPSAQTNGIGNRNNISAQQQLLANNFPSQALSLPPITSGSIVSGQPVIASQIQQQQNQTTASNNNNNNNNSAININTGINNANVPNLAPISPAGNAVLSNGTAPTPNSRPSGRTAGPVASQQQQQQQAAHRASPLNLVPSGAPEAKRPRIATPNSVVTTVTKPPAQQPSQPSSVLQHNVQDLIPAAVSGGLNCSQMSVEERAKHYEEIIDYVIANCHLLSPPKFMDDSISPTTGAAADLTLGAGSSTPSYSNSNIAGSLVSSNGANNAANVNTGNNNNGTNASPSTAPHDVTPFMLLHRGDMAANSPLPSIQTIVPPHVASTTANTAHDDLSPSSSSPTNSPNTSNGATLNGSGTFTNGVHSMPKKAWLQRMNEASAPLPPQPSTPMQTSMAHAAGPESQLSPTTMSTVSSSKSPVAARNAALTNGQSDGIIAFKQANASRSSNVSPTPIYIQPAPCMLAAPKISKCRECRLAQTNRPQNDSCRFEGFRRLRRTSRDHILSEGFLTLADVRPEDEEMWMPLKSLNEWHCNTEGSNDVRTAALKLLPASLARYAVSQLSSEFLTICRSELNVIFSLRTNIRSLSWRRREDRLRELCDVCQTTLFNLHWFCVKCGFAACMECFQQRQSEISNGLPEGKRWLTCLSANRAKHESDKLLPAVIIPPQCMQQVVSMVERCISQPQPIDGLLEAAAAVAAETPTNGGQSPVGNSAEARPLNNVVSSPLDILAEVAANSLVQTPAPKIPLKPDVYELISDQQLVRFLKPTLQDNNATWSLGQELMQRGKPFVVSSIEFRENWSPEHFSARFNQQRVALVNCVALTTVDHVSHADFWNGFRSLSSRIYEPRTQNHLCLKLKDWPADSRLVELLPDHYSDLISALPIPLYTAPGGVLNLPTYLPSSFVAPDLGPKVYAAYGTGNQTRVATTALHLDIADAVNVSIQVQPVEDDGGLQIRQVRDYVESCPFVAEEFKQRMRAGSVPGAIWHIFDTKDAENVRNYLNHNHVSKDRAVGVKDAAVRSSADPIHDQVWYLDDSMLAELRDMHQVAPYTIVQFVGDGIFIPAGCAHQVRNLHSCLKVAIDFVCPERVGVCHKLTDEFRRLPDSHLNHEDKLQLKNIVYHAVKDIVSAATFSANGNHNQIAVDAVDNSSNCQQQQMVAPVSPSAVSDASSDQRSPNLVIELDQNGTEATQDDLANSSEPEGLRPPMETSSNIARSIALS